MMNFEEKILNRNRSFWSNQAFLNICQVSWLTLKDHSNVFVAFECLMNNLRALKLRKIVLLIYQTWFIPVSKERTIIINVTWWTPVIVSYRSELLYIILAPPGSGFNCDQKRILHTRMSSQHNTQIFFCRISRLSFAVKNSFINNANLIFRYLLDLDVWCVIGFARCKLALVSWCQCGHIASHKENIPRSFHRRRLWNMNNKHK